MELRVGDTVYGKNQSDKFEITRFINSGGFGIVYEVKSENGEVLALKTVITASLNDTELQSLINEGRLATEIKHENVLQVFYFHDGNQYKQLPPYMLMEYANGGTLKEILDERKINNEYYNSDELREIFIQLASGMKAINEKLVHRDIKPDNILILNNTLKISDFGLSKVLGTATRTNTFKGINHVKYCAPEAWQLDKNLPSMDMYSMGITFYEIATLHHPLVVEEKGDVFDAWRNAHFTRLPTSPDKYNNSLDIKFAQVIMKMISKRPEERYSTWDEVIQRIQTNETKKTQGRNINTLIQKALATHNITEQARLEAENKRRKRIEASELVEFCFTEILEVAKETVNTFNDQSEFTKLAIQERSSMEFFIHSNRGVGAIPTVSVKIELANNIRVDKGQIIKAWGLAHAPSGRGFNLLLITNGDDDLYGKWQTLHVEHNPIMIQNDGRPEPFPFEFHELPKEIHLLNALHIFQTHQRSFKAEMLDSLIEELL